MVERYIKSNVCPLPWTHLEVDVNGGASPCCLYKGSVPNVKVYETGLKDIQQSAYMDNLRKQFRNGERPAGCQSCWQEEDAGKTSKRMNSLYKMKNSLTDWTPDSKPMLKFIDFKLGNVCNLKCRICGSWSSSKWAQEELDYGENPVARKNLTEGGWPKRNPQFFDDIKDDLKDVEYFEFTGGEPFMIRDHFKILMHCVEKGYAKNQDIHYNTNGTQLPPPEIFDLWSYFKRVEIAFSIDDIGPQFEYERHPANWREVNANLVKFKERQTPNMDFQICTTVSIFNVFNLAKIAFWVAQYQPKFFYVNTLFDPDYFNVQTLPQQVKDIVNQRYSQLKDFQPTLRFMNAADRDTPEIRQQRMDRILQADAYRHENFGDTFPLLNKVLKIYD
jgi:sulfatase maturation enzyme AslB (radical SAM superfamily)